MHKAVDAGIRTRRQGQFGQVMHRLRKNKIAMVGLVIMILLIIMALLSPYMTPYDYAKTSKADRYATPSWQHLFGCDGMGRDILSRIMYGARASLWLGLMSTLVATVIGVLLGSLVGYYGGKEDNIVMRIPDIIQAIPGMLLSIAISAALGSGIGNTILALSIGGVPMTVRLLRGSILTVRKQEYIEAAEKINCSKWRVITSHILPNSIAPVIVSVTMGIGNTILQAASLSYIGLGVQPPTPEWGAMLSEGKSMITKYPHLCIFPGLAIMLVVLCLNMLGDGLRDAMDPKLKN